jgi:glycogen(starch) synthase
VGRFVHWKGFDDLLEAVALARTKHPTVRLVLAGDGDLRGDLEAHAARIGLADHVTFTGMLPREEVVAQFAAADIVAVPSIHFEQFVDTGPTVALEAMAAGKPLVATPVGALPQLLGDGRAGRLVPERDPGALADAIGDLAADSTLRGKMGDRGRELVLQERNWDTVANELVALFERVRRS